MPPVLATAAFLCSTQAEALKHGALLLVRVVLFPASTELVAEIMVVPVALGWRFAGDIALLTRFRIDAQRAWCSLWEAGGAAITHKVSLAEELDQIVLAVA